MSDKISSEAELIALLAPLTEHAGGAFGLKDDCARLTPRTGFDLVLKTDPIRAGVHFFPDDPPDAIAWKALAVNLSDLAAKGATPVAYLMSLSFPEAPTRAWMTTFAKGLAEAQTAFSCTLIGGDTDKAPGPLSIAITIIGEVPTGRMIQRGTAKVGDGIYVSGTLGDSGLGLKLHREALESRNELQKKWGLTNTEARALVDKYLRPAPRVNLTSAVLAAASASMDVSDGLVKDLERMCLASGVGAIIDGASLQFSGPTSKVLTNEPASFSKIVSAGDDYEILATVSPKHIEAFQSGSAAAANGFNRIGTIVDHADNSAPRVTVTGIDGTIIPFDRNGWDHF